MDTKSGKYNQKTYLKEYLDGIGYPAAIN